MNGFLHLSRTVKVQQWTTSFPSDHLRNQRRRNSGKVENIKIFGYTHPKLAQRRNGDAVLKAFLTK